VAVAEEEEKEDGLFRCNKEEEEKTPDRLPTDLRPKLCLFGLILPEAGDGAGG